MRERIKSNLSIAIEAVFAHGIRSFLTALGIIFGVAAVIAMMAIGNGAQQEILEQIKLVGVNNIVIEPVVEQSEEDITENEGSGEAEKPKFSPGLTMLDVESIQNIVPGLAMISPEVMIDTYVINNGIRRTSKLVGVDPSFFEVSNLPLKSGRMFNDDQMERALPVCVIGAGVKAKFFPQEDPIGKIIKCGPHWLRVIGVLESRVVSQAAIDNLGIRDYNMDVYTPIKTMLTRFRNRAKVTKDMLGGGGGFGGGRMIIIGGSSNEEEASPESKNYHQLNRLVIQVADTESLTNTAEVISRMLERRHYGVVDYQITIPIQLLQQQQRTNDIFNYVLAAIAAISLVVGGIGIMNIMLASVLERIKEIGLRLAIGAKKNDIVMQFLLEAVIISLSGGILGIILGVVLANLVANLAEIPTVISGISVFVSFGVAAVVGLVFGIFPAFRAASQDPISSLRYE